MIGRRLNAYVLDMNPRSVVNFKLFRGRDGFKAENILMTFPLKNILKLPRSPAIISSCLKRHKKFPFFPLSLAPKITRLEKGNFYT